MKRLERHASEIKSLSTQDLDAAWEDILKELRKVQRGETGIRVGSSHSLREEFDRATARVAEKMDVRLVSTLEFCRSRGLNPEEAIRPVVAAMTDYFTARVTAYGRQRAENPGRYKLNPQLIIQASAKAVAAIKGRAKAAQMQALDGYAGGRMVCPRGKWRKPWWKQGLLLLWSLMPGAIRALISGSR